MTFVLKLEIVMTVSFSTLGQLLKQCDCKCLGHEIERSMPPALPSTVHATQALCLVFSSVHLYHTSYIDNLRFLTDEESYTEMLSLH